MVLEGSCLPRPDQELCELGARRWLTSFHVQDPVLRGWWLLWSVFASWLGVLPVPRVVAEAGVVQLRRREVDEGLRVVFHLYPLWVFLYVCFNVVYPCYYMNTSSYLSKKMMQIE